jgi:hypothetical protein
MPGSHAAANRMHEGERKLKDNKRMLQKLGVPRVAAGEYSYLIIFIYLSSTPSRKKTSVQRLHEDMEAGQRGNHKKTL